MIGLEIITPDRTVFEGNVDSVSFPGADGGFQVLQNHAPLISALAKGKVSYRVKKSETDLYITGGVVEVLNNHIILLADGIKE